jgi:hypothetical protein
LGKRGESYEELACDENSRKKRDVGGPSCLLWMYKKREKETKLGD